MPNRNITALGRDTFSMSNHYTQQGNFLFRSFYKGFEMTEADYDQDLCNMTNICT